MKATWGRIILLLLMPLLARNALADQTIPIYLDSPGSVSGNVPWVDFSQLDGTTVAGTLSLDFMFAQGEFVRVFSVTSSSLSFGFVFATDAGGFIDSMYGTGYALDQNGDPLPGNSVTASGSISDGEIYMGLFPLFKDDTGAPDTSIQRPLDIYGIHFDVTLPYQPFYHITDAQFQVFSYSPLGIGPGVPSDIPEPSTLALLVGVAISAALTSKREKRLRRET